MSPREGDALRWATFATALVALGMALAHCSGSPENICVEIDAQVTVAGWCTVTPTHPPFDGSGE